MALGLELKVLEIDHGLGNFKGVEQSDSAKTERKAWEGPESQ